MYSYEMSGNKTIQSDVVPLVTDDGPRIMFFRGDVKCYECDDISVYRIKASANICFVVTDDNGFVVEPNMIPWVFQQTKDPNRAINLCCVSGKYGCSLVCSQTTDSKLTLETRIFFPKFIESSILHPKNIEGELMKRLQKAMATKNHVVTH